MATRGETLVVCPRMSPRMPRDEPPVQAEEYMAPSRHLPEPVSPYEGAAVAERDMETREAEVSLWGAVKPQVMEEPRNEERVPPGWKWRASLGPQHVGGCTSSPPCASTPVSPWCLDHHNMIRQRSL